MPSFSLALARTLFPHLPQAPNPFWKRTCMESSLPRPRLTYESTFTRTCNGYATLPRDDTHVVLSVDESSVRPFIRLWRCVVRTFFRSSFVASPTDRRERLIFHSFFNWFLDVADCEISITTTMKLFLALVGLCTVSAFTTAPMSRPTTALNVAA